MTFRERIQPTLDYLWEVTIIVALALVIIVPLRVFVFQTYYVKGASMEPNFHNYEYLIIDKLSYRIGDPHRGDIVVLNSPTDDEESFIKRIIGLPGETVTVADAKVYIDGVALDESAYLPDEIKTWGDETVTVPENSYFVLGDNRTESLDSRIFGPIDRSEIIGKTWARTWPLKRLQRFDEVPYNS
jgi:signal peptidase I